MKRYLNCIIAEFYKLSRGKKKYIFLILLIIWFTLGTMLYSLDLVEFEEKEYNGEYGIRRYENFEELKEYIGATMTDIEQIKLEYIETQRFSPQSREEQVSFDAKIMLLTRQLNVYQYLLDNEIQAKEYYDATFLTQRDTNASVFWTLYSIPLYMILAMFIYFASMSINSDIETGVAVIEYTQGVSRLQIIICKTLSLILLASILAIISCLISFILGAILGGTNAEIVFATDVSVFSLNYGEILGLYLGTSLLAIFSTILFSVSISIFIKSKGLSAILSFCVLLFSKYLFQFLLNIGVKAYNFWFANFIMLTDVFTNHSPLITFNIPYVVLLCILSPVLLLWLASIYHLKRDINY
ncbi:MAG: ABC transporter permease subunit [Christensenellaceae bacterium]|nr:ABC transporter permease subunit [Christensenellaceae bacterium]